MSDDRGKRDLGSRRRAGNRPAAVKLRLGRPSLLAILALALGALVLAGCGGSDEDGSASSGDPGGDATAMRIAIIPTFGSLPVQAAAEEGIFARNGIDATVTLNPNIGSFPPALGRQYDVIMSTGVDFATAAANGIDIKAVSNMIRANEKEPNTPLIADPEAGIASPNDMAGKRIGVVSLAGTTYSSLLYLLDQEGVSRDDVDFVAVPFPSMADQVGAGQMDAAAATIPFFSQMLAQGDGIAFEPFVEAAEAATGQKEPTIAFLSTSQTFADENPKAIEAFRKSIAESIDWIEKNEPKARDLLATWLELPPEVAEKAPLPIYDASLTVEDLETWVTVTEAADEDQDVPPAESLLLE